VAASSNAERMSATDALFLGLEVGDSHMTVGAALTFEGTPPTIEELRDHVARRLDRVPRYRQRLLFPPLEFSRPLWADDKRFDISYHVRYSALPPPGGPEELWAQTAALSATRLDRSKPLWEFYLVGGCDEGWAMVVKSHHALTDGISVVDVAQLLFDAAPDAPQPHAGAWSPAPTPSRLELGLRSTGGLLRTYAGAARRAATLATAPSQAVASAWSGLAGAAELAQAALDPAPAVPLNGVISRRRSYLPARFEMKTFRDIQRAFGGTMNDVMLAAVCRGLARLLSARGFPIDELEVRASVPVSIRTADERGTLGNRVVTMRAALPVSIEDPVQCLRLVRRELDERKVSKQADSVEVLTKLGNVVPAWLVRRAAPFSFSPRVFNLLTTNIPGPDAPLYVMGRQMREAFPVSFLAAQHGLAVSILSYNGQINFGFLAEPRIVPDLHLVKEGVEEGLAELHRAAGERVDRRRRSGARG
jgi:diacylglycerol O-acyltransferase / wax synthase